MHLPGAAALRFAFGFQPAFGQNVPQNQRAGLKKTDAAGVFCLPAELPAQFFDNQAAQDLFGVVQKS